MWVCNGIKLYMTFAKVCPCESVLLDSYVTVFIWAVATLLQVWILRGFLAFNLHLSK